MEKMGKYDILKLLQYFVENDFAIYTDDKETLPDPTMDFSTPFEMLTTITIFNSDSNVEILENSITSLTNLDCQAIRIIDLGRRFNLPLIACGTYSRETGFVPDKKKIAELNKQIWGEE